MKLLIYFKTREKGSMLFVEDRINLFHGALSEIPCVYDMFVVCACIFCILSKVSETDWNVYTVDT